MKSIALLLASVAASSARAAEAAKPNSLIFNVGRKEQKKDKRKKKAKA